MASVRDERHQSEQQRNAVGFNVSLILPFCLVFAGQSARVGLVRLEGAVAGVRPQAGSRLRDQGVHGSRSRAVADEPQQQQLHVAAIDRVAQVERPARDDVITRFVTRRDLHHADTS